jgi:Uma2 family endonuclease
MADDAPKVMVSSSNDRTSDAALRRRFTVSTIFEMIDKDIIGPEESFELIEGDIIPISPKKNPHEALKLKLNIAFVRALPDHLLLGVETTVYLSDDTFVEPDLSLFPRELATDAVRGGDLKLVIEIAASTLRYDRDIKAPLYARHGVPLYWLIDVEAREVWAHAEPRADGRWGLIRRFGADDTLTLDAIPGFEIRLADLA